MSAPYGYPQPTGPNPEDLQAEPVTYTIDAVDEAAHHVVVTWTDAAGTLHDHEVLAGLWNVPIERHNPEYRPAEIENPDFDPAREEFAHNPETMPAEQADQHNPRLIPNPSFDPSYPLHAAPMVTELHSTPASIRAGIEAYIRGYNASLPAQHPPDVVSVRGDLSTLTGEDDRDDR